MSNSEIFSSELIALNISEELDPTIAILGPLRRTQTLSSINLCETLWRITYVQNISKT